MASSKIGKPTGKVTKAGRPVYKTPEGEEVSEKSVTISINGKWVNAPSIWNGKRLDEDGVERLLKEGAIKPTSVHDTLEEAVKAAEKRSSKLNMGGYVKSKQQTKKLLQEGGMLDEGGTVDPESGNEVPTGSLQEEVRDDIPAQLSEGEFVFPADVVRFIGLERLMQMRQAAKRGLDKMNDMGQMGNSEEATIDDGEDTEFETEIDDILSEVEAEAAAGKKSEGEQVKLATGGLLAPVDQQQGFVPPKINYEMKTFSKEGQPDVYIPFADGKPQLSIPQGYKETTKQVSFGGVLREPGQVKATVTESRGIRTGLQTPDRNLPAVGPKALFLKKDEPVEDPFKSRFTSTKPVANTDQKNIDRLKRQLASQYNTIRSNSEYRYQNENELDYIFTKQATQLAAQGINDIRDITLQEIPKTKTLTNIQKVGDKFYELIDDGESVRRQIMSIPPEKVKNVIKNEDGSFQIEVEDTPKKYIINKVTGERIQTREDHGGLTNRGWGDRWGWDNSVEGSVDFGIEFVDGNPIFIPVYKSTKTDLSGILTIATIALMASGIPAQIGQALVPGAAATGTAATAATAATTATTATATQLAVGNAVVSASIAVATGQDVVKAAALGGISGYAAGTLTPQFNTDLGNSILNSVGATGIQGAQTLGAVVSNSVVNGVMASIAGQDVGKAMLMGGVTGGVSANANDITKALIGDKGIEAITNATNFTSKQVQNLLSSSIVTGSRALVTNQDFFAAVTDHLLVQGLSTSATNVVVDGLRNSMSKENLQKIAKVTKLSTSIYVQAARKGLDPVKVMQQVYPAIVIKAME